MGTVRALTWNIFHGRDRPPNEGLFTLRSRLLRATAHDATHMQVNHPLLDEFAAMLAEADWSVCLLQEAPPAWMASLARRCGAEAHLVHTSRNQLAPVRRRLARWNPDLLGSWEGGSNITLARRPWRIVGREAVLLNPFPRRALRERRRLALTALAAEGVELCVGNLHATAGAQAHAEDDVRCAAARALGFAGDRPLLLGGDFNLRPESSGVFDELGRLGLAPPTAGDAIDHLLARGLEVVEPPHRWPPDRRELALEEPGLGPLRLRLSDHAPVEAAFDSLP